MTPVAAEGIALSPALAPLVAADAAGIAALICALHDDAGRRRDCSAAGLAMIAAHHSAAAVEHAMARAIGHDTQTQEARAG
jgi:GAF domain-containing protein